MTTIDEFDWEAFRRLVDEYERWLASASKIPLPDFESGTAGLLARLYEQGTTIRGLVGLCAATGEEGWVERAWDDDPASHEWMKAWKPHYDALSEVFGERNRYFFTFDPSENESVASTLADDLAEILTDLRAGASLYDASRLVEAAWEWSFRFSHWGHHAIAALSPLHWRVSWDADAE